MVEAIGKGFGSPREWFYGSPKASLGFKKGVRGQAFHRKSMVLGWCEGGVEVLPYNI